MVDVDRRMPPSLSAGLRRLSSRASSSATSHTAGLHSFAPFASSLISTFKLANIPLSPGLAETEIIIIESKINFTFPPDLRSLLSLAVPTSPGFPDWRFLPSLSLLSSWGPRSNLARSKLKRAPLLIPLFGRCYLPSRPSLAGNPVFYVDDSRIFCCALDLKDFFSNFFLFYSRTSPSSSCCCPSPVKKNNDNHNPRWIEFWSDVAESCNRRRSSSSSGSSRVSCSSLSGSCSSSADLGPDPESFVEIRPAPARAPARWVGKYMEEIGGALREGGWGEEEVEEMVHVSAACRSSLEYCEEVVAMRAEEMTRAGWRAEEVEELLGLKKKRRPVKLPPEIQRKVEKLAKEFNFLDN